MNDIKQILDQEIRFHTDEISRHAKIRDSKKYESKRQRTKILKHMHKRNQTIKIAEKLGLKVCDCLKLLKDNTEIYWKGFEDGKKESLHHNINLMKSQLE
jgi:hypothetical protein